MYTKWQSVQGIKYATPDDSSCGMMPKEEEGVFVGMEYLLCALCGSPICSPVPRETGQIQALDIIHPWYFWAYSVHTSGTLRQHLSHLLKGPIPQKPSCEVVYLIPCANCHFNLCTLVRQVVLNVWPRQCTSGCSQRWLTWEVSHLAKHVWNLQYRIFLNQAEWDSFSTTRKKRSPRYS